MKKWACFLLLLVLAAQCFGTPTRTTRHRKARRIQSRQTQPLPRLRCYDRVFYGSRESQLLQNAEIDRIGISRIQNDIELRRLVRKGELVPIYRGDGIVISPKLSASRLYVMPWVNDFLGVLGAAYHERFGSSLQINSATRTVQDQRKLARYNKNAAPAKGEIASSHLAGITVDIGRRNLTAAQVQFLEGHLLALGDSVIVIEEIRQPCFHICVRKPQFRIPLAPDVSNIRYVGSSAIDDWRYRQEEVDGIKTGLYLAESMTIGGRGADDIAEVKWFEINTLTDKDFEPEHRVLFNMLLKYLGRSK